MREETIDDALQSMSNAVDQIRQATSANTVQSRARELAEMIDDIKDKIQYQINITAIDTVVDKVFGDCPTINYGRNDIVFHVEKLVEKNAFPLEQLNGKKNVIIGNKRAKGKRIRDNLRCQSIFVISYDSIKP